MSEAELQELPRVGAIVEAAKGGRVPVGLVSSKAMFLNRTCVSSQQSASLHKDISEKNPLEILEDSATVVDLLSVFGSGTHRGKRFNLLISLSSVETSLQSSSGHQLLSQLAIPQALRVLSRTAHFSPFSTLMPSHHQLQALVSSSPTLSIPSPFLHSPSDRK